MSPAEIHALRCDLARLSDAIAAMCERGPDAAVLVEKPDYSFARVLARDVIVQLGPSVGKVFAALNELCKDLPMKAELDHLRSQNAQLTHDLANAEGRLKTARARLAKRGEVGE